MTRSWVTAGDRISRPDFLVLVLSETVLVLVLERAQVTERIFDHERLDDYRPAIEYEYRDAEYEYRDAEYENKKTTLRDDFEDGFDLDGRAGWDLGEAQSASGVEAIGIFAVDFVK